MKSCLNIHIEISILIILDLIIINNIIIMTFKQHKSILFCNLLVQA